MDADDVDVMAVERAQHLGPDHLGGGAAGRPAAGQVHDAIHDGQQGIDLVGGQQDADPLVDGDAVQHGHDLLRSTGVEIGEWLVEEQDPGPADEGVGDEHPLLLAARQVADAGVGEPVGTDGVQHVVHQLAAPAGPQGHAEAVPVDAQCHQVAGPHRESPARTGPSGGHSR